MFPFSFAGPPYLSLVWGLTVGISLILHIGATVAAVYAAIDAATRRPDAFAAADRQTKGVWAGITIACAAAFGLGWAGLGAFLPPNLLWLVAVVGVLVYLLDVRPRLREVQRGSRW